MSGIAWTAIRNAIQAWVVAGSGLAGDHVIWTGQSAARPTGPFVELKLYVDAKGRGIDAQRFTLVGNVLTEKLIGQRRAILTITAWQGAPQANAGYSVPGDASFNGGAFGPFADDYGFAAPVVLDDILTAARLATINDALTAAGVGVGSVDTIHVQGDVINDVEFETRSIASVTLHVASEVSYVYPTGQGWISTVNAAGLPGDLQPISFSVTG